MGNHEYIMQNYPNGTYADFCQRQAASEAQTAAEPTSEERNKEDEIEKEPEAETAGRTLSRKKTIKDAKGRVATITLDAQVSEKLNEADDNDAEYEKKVEKQMEPLREQSDFMKVMKFNNPIWMLYAACFTVSCAGFCQPAFGWVFSKMITTLTLPIKFRKMALMAENPPRPASDWSK